MVRFGDGMRRCVLFALAVLVARAAGPRPSQGHRFLRLPGAECPGAERDETPFLTTIRILGLVTPE